MLFSNDLEKRAGMVIGGDGKLKVKSERGEVKLVGVVILLWNCRCLFCLLCL